MGNKLAQDLVKTQERLETLRGKTLALDVSPYVYGAIYGTYRQGQALTSKTGRLTGHIMRILDLLSRLKDEYQISVVVCIDDRPPALKCTTNLKRRKSGLATLGRIEDKARAGPLTLNEQRVRNLYTTMLDMSSRDRLITDLIEVLTLAGISYARLPYHEAQKVAHSLKQHGIVDDVCSPDRDVCLYGSDLVAKIDLRRGTYERTWVSASLVAMGLIHLTELQLVAIAAGTDYHDGIYGMGPKGAIRMLRQMGVEAFRQHLRQKGVPVDQILAYYQDRSGYQGLSSATADPDLLRGHLQELNFSDARINQYLLKVLGPIDLTHTNFVST